MNEAPYCNLCKWCHLVANVRSRSQFLGPLFLWQCFGGKLHYKNLLGVPFVSLYWGVPAWMWRNGHKTESLPCVSKRGERSTPFKSVCSHLSTLLYPVSLLIGCWDDQYIQRASGQYRDHLTNQILTWHQRLVVWQNGGKAYLTYLAYSVFDFFCLRNFKVPRI